MGSVRRVLAGHAHLPEGTIAVTFELESAAKTCASKMSGRWFDGHQLETKLCLPKTNISAHQHTAVFSKDRECHQHSLGERFGIGTHMSVAALCGQDLGGVTAANEAHEPLSAEIVQEVEDVENFLNSLL